MLVDKAKITIISGKGGNGSVSFRREPFVPEGGPDGGDGGNGGNVIFKADRDLRTLMDFRYKRKYQAENGQNGMKKKCYGKRGEDLIIKVPVGTMVFDAETGHLMHDLREAGDSFIAAKGGRGGKGNVHFKNSVRQAPNFAEAGTPGKEREVILELKMIADVGLVGFPNVGKSSLLAVSTNAKPKIENYHFTTIDPNLGVVQFDDSEFIMADIAGIIEGAHQGAGLGLRFLKHIERCRVIIHVVDMSPNSGRDPVEDYRIINRELEEYKYRLLQRPQIVVANKMDEDGAEENLERFRQAYPELEVFPVISLIGDGMQAVLYKAADLLDVTEPFPLEDENEEIGVVYGYVKEEEPFIIRNLGNGSWSLESERITRLMARTNFEDEEQIIRFGMSLKKMGVDDALRERGAKETDTVYIDDYIFELTELL